MTNDPELEFHDRPDRVYPKGDYLIKPNKENFKDQKKYALALQVYNAFYKTRKYTYETDPVVATMWKNNPESFENKFKPPYAFPVISHQNKQLDETDTTAVHK